jgi:hypothetical protein
MKMEYNAAMICVTCIHYRCSVCPALLLASFLLCKSSRPFTRAITGAAFPFGYLQGFSFYYNSFLQSITGPGVGEGGDSRFSREDSGRGRPQPKKTAAAMREGSRRKSNYSLASVLATLLGKVFPDPGRKMFAGGIKIQLLTSQRYTKKRFFQSALKFHLSASRCGGNSPISRPGQILNRLMR